MSSKGNVRFSVLEHDTNNGVWQRLVRKHRITIAILCVVFLIAMLSVLFYFDWAVRRYPNNSPVLRHKQHQNLPSEAPFKILERSTTSAGLEMSSKQEVLSSPFTSPTQATLTFPTRAPTQASTTAPILAPTRAPSRGLDTLSVRQFLQSSTEATKSHSTGDDIGVSNSPAVESVTNLKQITKLRQTNFTPQDGEKYYISSKSRGEAVTTFSFAGSVLTYPLARAIEQEFRFKSTGVPNHYNILDFENRRMTYKHVTYSVFFEEENLADGLKQEWIVERDRGNAYTIKPAFDSSLCFIDVDALNGFHFSNHMKLCDNYAYARGWLILKVVDDS